MKPYDPGHARTQAAMAVIAAQPAPPKRVAAMLIVAKTRRAWDTGARLWDRVWYEPNGTDGYYEVHAVRDEGSLNEVSMWAFVREPVKGRSKFVKGLRFSLGSVKTISTPREWNVWLDI